MGEWTLCLSLLCLRNLWSFVKIFEKRVKTYPSMKNFITQKKLWLRNFMILCLNIFESKATQVWHFLQVSDVLKWQEFFSSKRETIWSLRSLPWCKRSCYTFLETSNQYFLGPILSRVLQHFKCTLGHAGKQRRLNILRNIMNRNLLMIFFNRDLFGLEKVVVLLLKRIYFKSLFLSKGC